MTAFKEKKIYELIIAIPNLQNKRLDSLKGHMVLLSRASKNSNVLIHLCSLLCKRYSLISSLY